MKLIVPFILALTLFESTAEGKVVLNEILAHSHDEAPDWIELYNDGPASVALEGWTLSDDKDNLGKYTIPTGVVIDPGGYLVLDQHETFGAPADDSSSSANQPFALSENGETLYLTSPSETIEQKIGPTPTGVPMGRYTDSSGGMQFVAMAEPTPGEANSAPRVGPIVITEIMYHPLGDGDLEYVEITNLSDTSVVLFDEVEQEPWRIGEGISFTFPTDPKFTMQPHERILLAKNESALRAAFTLPPTTRVIDWGNESLSNSGEGLEIVRPGDVGADGVLRWIRVDFVAYSDSAPWPAAADGEGASLIRLDESGYGNDTASWIAAAPTPGYAISWPFHEWSIGSTGNHDAPWADPDADGIRNLLEYVIGSDPLHSNACKALELQNDGMGRRLNVSVARTDPALDYLIEQSASLFDWQMSSLVVTKLKTLTLTLDPSTHSFYRFAVVPAAWPH